MATATAESTKAEALRMIDAGESQATVAKAVGVDRGTVCRWVAKRNGRTPTARASTANGNGAAVANGPSVARVVPLARPVVSEETAALRARVRELEEECACLRKAVGYVSRGVK